MDWTIPEPYAIPSVKPLRWSGWWRGFSLCAMTILLVGCGGYFWLKDPRLLLYTFGGVVVLILVFAGIAGWNMYRYGVEAEHAEDISNLNRLTTLQWQRWAQQSVAVLGFHAFFPAAVLSPGHNEGPVNGDKPLLLPPFNGYGALFPDLLLPLLPELQQLVAERISLEVTLPEGCGTDKHLHPAFHDDDEREDLAFHILHDHPRIDLHPKIDYLLDLYTFPADVSWTKRTENLTSEIWQQYARECLAQEEQNTMENA